MKQYSDKLAVLIKAVQFNLPDLPEISAYVDTGYDKETTTNVLKKMYKHNANKPFGLYLFGWILKENEEKYPEGIHDGEIKFSQNWNGKLHCKYWTTIRLWNQNKYKAGGLYRIYWKERRC